MSKCVRCWCGCIGHVRFKLPSHYVLSPMIDKSCQDALLSSSLCCLAYTHQQLQTTWYNTRNINHDYLTQASFNSTICYSFHWTNFQAMFCMSEPSFLNLKLDSPRQGSWSDHRTQCPMYHIPDSIGAAYQHNISIIMGIFYTTTVAREIVFQFRVLKLELTTGFNCFVI